MAVSEGLQIVDLGVDAIEGGMLLSSEAGWNQTAADWRHFIAKGRTIGVRDDDGRLVASAAALPYDGPFGFVGMVLVTEEWRRRGLATRLVARCVETLKAQGLVPVLDATAAGETVYVQQGFVPQLRFDRWQGIAKGEAIPTGNEAVAEIIELDATAFGAARPALMGDFLAREGTLASSARGGFAMVRHGRRAWQAGPIVATDEAAALGLVQQMMRSVSGLVFIDVPQRWHAIGDWLKQQGFSVQRGFARMALGRSEPFGDPSRLFAVAGPEFG